MDIVTEVKTSGGHVLIISDEPNGLTSRSLLVKLHDVSVLEGFELPKMRHIFNDTSNGRIIISLLHEPLMEYFHKFLDALVGDIQPDDDSGKLLDRIIDSFNSLKKLVQQNPFLSHEHCKGLYGELLFLLDCLDKQIDPGIVIEAWHGPDSSAHDFIFDNQEYEIKSISRMATQIQISSEHQLRSIPNKKLLLVVNKIETIRNTNVDSLGELYLKVVRSLYPMEVVKLFKQKCESVGIIGYYGPDNVTYKYKFKPIETSIFDVDNDTFPKLYPENIPSGISRISYSIDLSSMEAHNITL